MSVRSDLILKAMAYMADARAMLQNAAELGKAGSRNTDVSYSIQAARDRLHEAAAWAGTAHEIESDLEDDDS